jgi:hypothetical protein
VNVVLNVGPLASWVGELVGNAPGAVKYVTSCRVVPEFHVHVTIPPARTIVSRGVKAKLVTLTPTAVGGADPTSVNVAALANPVKLAATLWSVEDPRESIVVATPFALVVLCAGLTPPSPVTAHVTTTPGTGWPLTSTAVTLNGVGSGLLKYQFCASPPLFRRSKGGPAGWVLFPLQAHAETPATRVITRFVAMDVRTALGSGSASTRSLLPTPVA